MPIIGTTIFGFGAMMTLYALSRKLKRGFQRFFLPVSLFTFTSWTLSHTQHLRCPRHRYVSHRVFHPMLHVLNDART
jgi:hypothetical protein